MGYVLATVEGQNVAMRIVSYDVRAEDSDQPGERAPAFESVRRFGVAAK